LIVLVAKISWRCTTGRVTFVAWLGTRDAEVKMRIRNGLATIVVSSMAAAAFAVVTPCVALADTGTTGEVAAALDTVDARNGSLVAEPVPSTTDGDSAAQTATVDIPADPTKGVRLKGQDGTSMTVKLPGARKGDRGKKARNGTVVFDTKADSVNAAVPAEGGVQLWTHIRNKRAPETYRYCADGVTFAVSPEGGAIGINQANQPVTIVPPPTATEKKTGKSIATSYKADGNCLTQHVAHKAKGVSYPVVADPFWFFVPAWVLRACGLGFIAGWGGAVINGDDFWRRWGNGLWNCVVTAVGLGWLKK
jgi:hypothetical protein